MVVLGISDARDSGAALVLDGTLVAVESEERYDRTRGTRAFPWTSVDMVLESAGLRNRDVDVVAVAGRFSPPFFARKHPAIRAYGRDVFSPMLDGKVFFQAMLRQTGLGAADADRASEWFEELFRKRGFRPQRVVLVDVHGALASAAYRCQPDDDVLAVTLQPMGDGVSLALHRGNAGQIDRAWAQKGFSALHVHLQRCAAAMGFDPYGDEPALWAAAGRGESDLDLVGLLGRTIYADGPRLVRRRTALPVPRQSALYRAIADAPRDIAAASVLEHLVDVVTDVVRWHVRREGVRDLALGGAVFANPRLVAEVAGLPEVDSVWVDPAPGWGALATGAAAAVGGVAPHALPVGLGRQYHENQLERALTSAGIKAVRAGDPAEAAAGLLAAGKPIARFQGRAGFGPAALGTRSVLVRADDPAAVARARTMLGRPTDEEPLLAWLENPGDGVVHNLGKAWEASRFGTVAFQVDAQFAVRYPGAVTPDGRVHLLRVDPEGAPHLHRVLTALHRRSGCAGLAVLPFALGKEPPVAVPGDALRVWRHAGLPALWFGPYLVQTG